MISSFHPVVGGAERATALLTRTLAQTGVDVCILTRRQPDSAAVDEIDGVRVLRAGVASKGKLGSLTFGVHGVWLVARALREYGILHVQNLDTPLLIAVLCRAFLGRRVVATIHSEGDIRLRSRTLAGRGRLRMLRRWVDRFTAISPALASELEGIGIEASRISQIPNSVDTTSIRPASREKRAAERAALGLPSDSSAAVLSFVGRLVPLKQVDVLLRALHGEGHVRDAWLVIAGDGPERDRLKALTAELGLLDRVVFTGMLGDTRPVLAASDVFVLPSRKEGLSMALLEAQAAGLASIVSDLPGNRALVQDGVTGRIVPSGDEGALADAIAALLADADKCSRMGRDARAHVTAACAPDLVASRHRVVYAGLS